jgi:hypothetical protein
VCVRVEDCGRLEVVVLGVCRVMYGGLWSAYEGVSLTQLCIAMHFVWFCFLV